MQTTRDRPTIRYSSFKTIYLGLTLYDSRNEIVKEKWSLFYLADKLGLTYKQIILNIDCYGTYHYNDATLQIN